MTLSTPVSLLGWVIVGVLLALTAWSWWLIAGWVLRPLADAIDDALDRLAAGYESQRRFAANASPELRTPLAVQRLLTEVALEDPAAGLDLRRLGGQLLVANARNERVIEGLLTLAESDRGLQGVVPLRLDDLAARVGLGRAIVRSIVAAHTGTLQARPRQDGGLEVRIELPARPG